MLQYRQNINYFEGNYINSLDDELREFIQCIKSGLQDYDLYMNIRNKIYKEIKIEQLAATRILRDILEIENQSKRAKDIICYFVVNNTQSYKQIAEHFNTSKQNIYQIIKRYSEDYIWIENLMKIKSYEDRKNENNITRFFNKDRENEID